VAFLSSSAEKGAELSRVSRAYESMQRAFGDYASRTRTDFPTETIMSENDKKNTAIVPAGGTLPGVHIEEISESDLDEVDGGCSLWSCLNTCGNTTGGKEKAE